MIVYIACPPKQHEAEVELIEKLAAFEGITVFNLWKREDGMRWVRQHYKGGRPVAIIGNAFIDEESDRLHVVTGFYAFADFLREKGLTRA